MNILRRLPLSRLLLAVRRSSSPIGVSATALAFALGRRARRRRRSRSLTPSTTRSRGARGEPIQGVSANITLTDHLLEGASLASGGHVRRTDVQPADHRRLGPAVDRQGRPRAPGAAVRRRATRRSSTTGTRCQLYDAATNTLYRYTPPARRTGGRAREASGGSAGEQHEVPTVAKIEEAIAHAQQARGRLRRHAHRRRRPARLHGARLAERRRQPARRRRAVLRRRQRRAAARRRLLHDQLRAGDRTRGQRNLLRPGRRARCSRSRRRPTPRSRKSLRPSPPSAHAQHEPAATTESPRSPPTATVPPRSRCCEAKAKARSKERRRTARRAAEGHDQRHQRQRAAHRARHAAHVRALRRALPARRLRHAQRDRSSRTRPLA